MRNSFLHKNGNRTYKYLVLGCEGPYFEKEYSSSKSKYTDKDIIKMLEFLVDNIFAGKVFQQMIGIPIGTNCAPQSKPTYFCTETKQKSYRLLALGR